MNELFEEVAKITETGAEFHIYKFKFSKHWSCVIERKDEGVNVKIDAEGFDCPEAIGVAVDKWNRITSGVREFSGQLLEHVRPAPAPEPFNDSIPF